MSRPVGESHPDALPAKALGKVVAATVAVQVAIVMSSLTVPVLASVIFASAGIAPYLVGYYSSAIYGCAAATSLATPGLLRRWGAIRLHQGMLVLTAAALMALLPALPAAFALSALVLGLAYGPMNPASTVLLAQYTPPRLRGRVFSLKQTAVPAGGALAGSVMPVAAAMLGWRGTMLLIAIVCLGLALLIQPWRGELDHDRAGDTKLIHPGFWLPARLMAQPGGLRIVAVASFAFGAVQFSFSALFPTVLVSVGWSLCAAGSVLAVALAVGVVCRIIWGSVADRVGTRPILGVMGVTMSLAAFVGAFVTAAWSGTAVLLLAMLFGVSAYCWAGIGLAETVRQAPPALLSEASAGVIAFTFLGALAGPALFSTATALTGSFRPAFLILAALAIVPSLLLLRPLPALATLE